MYCPECGSPNPDNANYCNACNATLTPKSAPTPAPQMPSESAVPVAPPSPSAIETPSTTVIHTPPPPPPSKPTNKQQPQNRTIIILCAIIVVCLLAGAGLYFLGFAKGANDRKTENFEKEMLAQTESISAETEAPYPAEYPADVNNPDERFQSFDWLSERRIDTSDLTGLSSDDLRLLRNAIFAMHGYIFKSEDLQQYFGRFDWYIPRYSNVPNSRMSSIETDNISVIKSLEKQTR